MQRNVPSFVLSLNEDTGVNVLAIKKALAVFLGVTDYKSIQSGEIIKQSRYDFDIIFELRETGKEALDFAIQRIEEEKPIDLIFMDNQLPELLGSEVVKKIREREKQFHLEQLEHLKEEGKKISLEDFPNYELSHIVTFSNDEQYKNAHQDGANEGIKKPLNAKQFHGVLEREFGKFIEKYQIAKKSRQQARKSSAPTLFFKNEQKEYAIPTYSPQMHSKPILWFSENETRQPTMFSSTTPQNDSVTNNTTNNNASVSSNDNQATPPDQTSLKKFSH